MYNGLSRNIETELIPAIRKFDMRFYAYNPLAGGLLSGKYNDFDQVPTEGRFKLRPNYQGRYWKKSFFGALKLLSEECKDHNISLPEAAYRWLSHHSALDEMKGDGILIGASKLNHLKMNIEANSHGRLPVSIVNAFEESWSEAKVDSPDYFRFIPNVKA